MVNFTAQEWLNNNSLNNSVKELLLSPLEKEKVWKKDTVGVGGNLTGDLVIENEPLVLFATVGTFNQKDKETGNRQIYQCRLDEQNQSTWDSLKNRDQRPLFIVYDEGHNLSNQKPKAIYVCRTNVLAR